jgi:uncharacterized iron-regulated protein
MKKLLFPLLLVVLVQPAMAGKPAWQLFASNGEAVQYQTMANKLLNNDVVFFGELHNNPIAHWLQLELARDLHERSDRQLVLGAEMFEADDQLIVNEYLKGWIREKNFREEAKLWDNYSTDYRPLLEYAKKEGLPFIATNIPRRYASMVAGGGFDTLNRLTEEALQYIAPLPIEYDPDLPGYKRMLKMKHTPGMKQHNKNLPKAQAIKDATMAHFIIENRGKGDLLLHFNGTYHSNNKEGIVWYMRRHAAGTKVATIATVEQADLEQLADKNHGLADFILVVDKDMTTTY